MSRRSTNETEAVVKVVGQRYCLDHQASTDAELGSTVPGKRPRWICFECQRRRAEFMRNRK